MTSTAPWLAATRQMWKLVVLYGLTGAAIFAAVGAVVPSVGNLITYDRDWFQLGGPIVGILWLGWMAFAFRCPACGARAGWWYLKQKPVSQWFTSFVTARTCPACGDAGKGG
jgi:hypothetical protein